MDGTRQFGSSRREVMTAGIGVGTTALAGCLGGTGAGPAGGSESGSYTVTMAPTGESEFDAVPENAFVTFTQYADMAVALGHGDAVSTLFAPEMSGTTMNKFYERLPGVSFDWDNLENPLENGVTKEQLYSAESDVHFLDPSYVLTTQDDWTASDIEEIADRIAPWIGSYHSGVHSEPAAAYADSYEYYTLWELSRRSRPSFENGSATRRSKASTRTCSPESSRPCRPKTTDRRSPASRWATACSIPTT